MSGEMSFPIHIGIYASLMERHLQDWSPEIALDTTINCCCVTFCQFNIVYRVEKTEFNDTTLVATVRKYGRPTLVEEVEGRVFHTVTIQQKCLTRSRKRQSDFYKHSYHCTCIAEKSVCIHIALLLLSEFVDPEQD